MRAAAPLCVGISVAACAFAQTRDAKPAFEVASVRRSVSQSDQGTFRGGPGTEDPARITYLNVPLRMILLRIFGLETNDQLEGPDWINTNRYDIAANVPPGITPEQCTEMLRNLLMERLQMVVRHAARDVDGYKLTVARSGSKLRVAAAEAAPAPVPDGFPPAGPGGIGVGAGNGIYLLTARHKSTSFLLQLLAVQLHAEIDDQTGLDGIYDYNLGFVPARFLDTVEDHRFPDLVTAVEDQLGLKLVQVKHSVDVVVIEKANPEPLGN